MTDSTAKAMGSLSDLLLDYVDTTRVHDSNYDIAQGLLRNYTRLGSMSLRQMADACFVSKASLSRFCRFMGFESFAEFKEAVDGIDYRVTDDYSRAFCSELLEDREAAFNTYRSAVVDVLGGVSSGRTRRRFRRRRVEQPEDKKTQRAVQNAPRKKRDFILRGTSDRKTYAYRPKEESRGSRFSPPERDDERDESEKLQREQHVTINDINAYRSAANRNGDERPAARDFKIRLAALRYDPRIRRFDEGAPIVGRDKTPDAGIKNFIERFSRDAPRGRRANRRAA